jgi:mono/diheme cytochrome c family protein
MMEPFNSAMPAWKDTLSEDEIWQVIAYIREFAEDGF